MSVNKTVFSLPQEVLEEKENTAVKRLRRLLLNADNSLASAIGTKFEEYIKKHLGNEGECDLRDVSSFSVTLLFGTWLYFAY